MSIARFLGPGSPIQPFVRQDLAWGINQARRNGADVLNLSWGHDALQGTYIVDAIDSAVRFGRDGLGSVVVGISQNDGNTNAPHVRFPATLQNVIAVGAIDRNGRRANFSNFGPQLDVVAPGVDIRTTAVNNSYTFIDGTSFAAPHVAGIAALILSVRPDLRQDEVRKAIESTARKLSSYTFDTQRPNGSWNDEVGYGLVNAYAALRAVLPSFILGPPEAVQFQTAQYTIDLLPPDATVTWTAAPTNIVPGIVGFDNVFSAMHFFSGWNEIRANITTNYVSFEIGPHHVWVEPAEIPITLTTGSFPIARGIPTTFSIPHHIASFAANNLWGMPLQLSSIGQLTTLDSTLNTITVQATHNPCIGGSAGIRVYDPYNQKEHIQWVPLQVSNNYDFSLSVISEYHDVIPGWGISIYVISNPDFPSNLSWEVHNGEILNGSNAWNWPAPVSSIWSMYDQFLNTVILVYSGGAWVNCTKLNTPCGPTSSSLMLWSPAPAPNAEFYFVHPNPVSSTLYFKANPAFQQSSRQAQQQDVFRVQLLSVNSGAVVFERTVANFDDNFDFDLSGVRDGMYVLVLKQGNDIIQQQTIRIQH